MLKTLERRMTLKQHDTHSGHVWMFEIDAIKPRVTIYKNGKAVRRIDEILLPVSDSWLTELREGL